MEGSADHLELVPLRAQSWGPLLIRMGCGLGWGKTLDHSFADYVPTIATHLPLPQRHQQCILRRAAANGT